MPQNVFSEIASALALPFISAAKSVYLHSNTDAGDANGGIYVASHDNVWQMDVIGALDQSFGTNG